MDTTLSRSEYVLAVLASCEAGSLSPVQVQKLFFLLDKNAAHLVSGPHFDFQPWDYGPFDRAVYNVLESLEPQGMVDIVEDVSPRSRTYRITALGLQRGSELAARLEEGATDYIRRLSDWIRGLSFAQLVSAVYAAYPDMKARSVFQG